MKTSVVYATKTGHSRKIAQAVAQSLGVEARDVKENPKPEAADLLILVGGIYGNKCSPELVAYAGALQPGQICQVALMTSCGGLAGRQDEIRGILSGKGIPVLEEEFVCRGGILFVGMGHPDKADIKNAVDFARKAAEQG